MDAKQQGRVTEAREGCVAGHGRWSMDGKRGAGRCPSHLASAPPPRLCLVYQVPVTSVHPYIDPPGTAAAFFPRLLSARVFWLLSSFPPSSRETFITQDVKLTRFNPLLMAPNLSVHTAYAGISYLLNYFTPQLLTEETEGTNPTQTVKMIVRKQKIHRKHNSFLRPLEIQTFLV